jgi:hypothetical protein
VCENAADIRPTTACDLLSASRRLATVVAVEEAEEPVSAAALARMTAAAEHGRAPGRLGGRTGDAVQADLEAVHLPRLVEHDVLRDAEEGYAAGANLSAVLAVADTAADRRDAEQGDVLAPAGRQPGGSRSDGEDDAAAQRPATAADCPEDGE